MNIKGLTNTEVEERKQKGLINYVDEPKTKTIKEIIKTNALTYFNFLNIALGLMVLISGIVSGKFLYALKNCLFVNVIFTNTIISIIEEILAKKTIDKLSEVVFNLLQEEDCHIVDFKGSKLYSKGIAKKLQNYKFK